MYLKDYMENKTPRTKAEIKMPPVKVNILQQATEDYIKQSPMSKFCKNENEMSEPIKKYYFVSYAVRPNDSDNYSYSNFVIDQLPLKWIIEMNKQHRNFGDCRLLYWQEISKEDYIFGNDNL